MSRHGFRFVHATCLCLDEHLVGTGPLSAQDRALAEDATFHAWDGIVRTCIDAQAEFLILTGNSFNAKTNSLRARVALEKGFEQLAAHDISVFIVPGVLDPVSAWKRNLRLPPNVTLLADEDHEPVAVMQEQRVLASIFVIATAKTDEAKWSDSGPAAFQRHQAPFQIGLVGVGTPIRWEEGRPIPLEHHDGANAAITLLKTAIDHHTDYIALGEGIPRTEHLGSGTAHDPGCAQSLSSQICGSRGCSVVHVDATGETTIDPVAVAPIRWEELSLTLENSTNDNDLIEKMALILMEQVPDNDEKLWIITWHLKGQGPLYDRLHSPSTQEELLIRLEEELAGEKSIRRVHRIQFAAAPLSSDTTTPAPESHSPLLQDFQSILQECSEELMNEVRPELLALDWLKAVDARPIREALQSLSRQQVAQRAQVLVSQWLE